MVRFLRPHDRVVDVHQTVDDIREVLILRYLYHLVADTERAVHLRDLGNALHVPYDDAMRLARQLEEDGFLHPLGDTREPGGPGLRLTTAGRRAAAEEEV